MLVVAVLFGAGVSVARAQAVDAPTVTRGQGAEACPDVPALRAQIAAIGGLADAFSRSGYAVEFAYAAARGGTFSARIRTRAATGERLLEAQAGSCAPLARATAVTLALLLDNEARRAPTSHSAAVVSPPQAADESDSSPPPPAAPPSEAERSPTQDTRAASAGDGRARRIDRAAVAVGAAGLFGVVRTLAPALLGQLSLTRGRLELALGALWALPYTREFSPGTLQAKLASGLLRVCAETLRSRLLRLSACSGVYAGVLTVEANGFTDDRTRHEAWVSVPLELTLATFFRSGTSGRASRGSTIGLALTAGALLPIRRHDFSIDGLGKALRSWPVAALLALSLEVGSNRERAGSQDTTR